MRGTVQREYRQGTQPEGLYHPALDHDSCGIGFVADIKGRKSHQIITQGLTVLANLTHRGAVGADPLAGDGAGMLLQIPDAFFRSEMANLGIDLPDPGDYGVGQIFLPQDPVDRVVCENLMVELVIREGQKVLGWRDVPVDPSCLGESVKPIEPVMRQLFVGRGDNITDTDHFERKLYTIRKQAHTGLAQRAPYLIERGVLDDFMNAWLGNLKAEHAPEASERDSLASFDALSVMKISEFQEPNPIVDFDTPQPTPPPASGGGDLEAGDDQL